MGSCSTASSCQSGEMPFADPYSLTARTRRLDVASVRSLSMSPTKEPPANPRPARQGVGWKLPQEDAAQLRRLAEEARSGLETVEEFIDGSLDVHAASVPVVDTEELSKALNVLASVIHGVSEVAVPAASVRSYMAIAHNMADGIAALGPALAEIETPVSPQLARSLAATENAWRMLEAEFGLLSSREVSELVGSSSPNRSYASDQRSKGKLIAVRRPGGLRYPGYQFDRTEHVIRPVMADLIRIAREAGRSEASVALWMVIPTGYLDGDRPVDQLSDPDKVVEAAQQSFNVQW